MTEPPKILSESAAIRYIGRGRKFFKSAVMNREIGSKKINGRRYYTIKELERWLKELELHTESTSEARPTTRISRFEPSAGNEYSFAKLLEQRTKEKQNNTVLNGLGNCNRLRSEKKKAS